MKHINLSQVNTKIFWWSLRLRPISSCFFFYFSDRLPELTVRRLFVFFKENLIFSSLQDEFYARNFFPDTESEEYVFGKTGDYYRCERFLKLLIKKKRCKEFFACMHDLPSYKHVFDEILKFQKNETNTSFNGKCKYKPVFFLLCEK